MNRTLISIANATAVGTRFTCSLDVSANLATPMFVERAYAEAGDECAQGVLKVAAPLR